MVTEPGTLWIEELKKRYTPEAVAWITMPYWLRRFGRLRRVIFERLIFKGAI